MGRGMDRYMQTLREWLDAAKFDWEHGKIVLQEAPKSQYYDGPDRYADLEKRTARELSHDDPVLDRKFSTSYGGVSAPQFIAEDGGRIYFVGCYDGSSWLEYVWKDLGVYLRLEAEVPEVGAG